MNPSTIANTGAKLLFYSNSSWRRRLASDAISLSLQPLLFTSVAFPDMLWTRLPFPLPFPQVFLPGAWVSSTSQSSIDILQLRPIFFFLFFFLLSLRPQSTVESHPPPHPLQLSSVAGGFDLQGRPIYTYTSRRKLNKSYYICKALKSELWRHQRFWVLLKMTPIRSMKRWYKVHKQLTNANESFRECSSNTPPNRTLKTP